MKTTLLPKPQRSRTYDWIKWSAVTNEWMRESVHIMSLHLTVQSPSYAWEDVGFTWNIFTSKQGKLSYIAHVRLHFITFEANI